MSEWRKIKLSEVLTEKTERNKNEETDLVLSVTNSQGFVKQADYFEGTVHSEDISNYKLVRKNEFAYNPSRINVGSIDILKNYEIGALSPMYVIFKVDESKLLPDYFKYFFQTHRFIEDVKNNTQGSVRNSLSFKALCEFEYLLPPLQEQKKIVDILCKVNEIIKKYQDLINDKDQFIKSQFVEMFGSIKNSKYVKDKIANVVNKNIMTVKKKYNKSDEIEYIDISSINKEKNIIEETTTFMVENAPSRAQQCLEKSDILISTVRPNLKNIAIFEKSINNAVGSSGFCVLRCTDKVNLYYMFNMVNSDIFTTDMVLKTTGSNYPAIRDSDILEYEIPIPPIELQNKFGKIVKLIDKQKFHSVIKNIMKIKESEVYV